MKDENRKELSEKEILKNALDHMSDACCFLFEIETDEGKMLAFMADALLKLGIAVYHDQDPRLAATSDELEVVK